MTTTITCNVVGTGEQHALKAVQRGLLAINAAVYVTRDETQRVDGYCITHVPTGLAICRCRSVWKARRALRALLKCGNWDLSTPIVDGHGETSGWPPAFRKKAQKTAMRFHERPYWHHR